MKKPNKRITLVDIAKELGLSTATVSMVLSGNGPKNRISKKAIQRVIETAERLEYKPNLLAKSLRTGKTGVIGLIVADISNPFFARIARLLENEASKFGYDVMFASSDEDLNKFRKFGNAFITKQVDGMIIVPVIDSQDVITEWQTRGIPLVSFDRHISSLSIPYAVTDNFNASITILNYILKKGYKRIAFVGKESNLSNFIDREKGFVSGAKGAKLNTKQYTVFKLDYFNWENEIWNTLQKILNDDYDIIIFSQNILGTRGLKFLNSLDVQIPHDIAVISFDNPDVFEFNDPPITCFEQPLKILAKKSLIYLMDMINGTFVPPRTYTTFKGRLIIRESC